MTAARIHPQRTAITITPIIVLTCFLRFQSALPREVFGICGLNALPSSPFWQFNYCLTRDGECELTCAVSDNTRTALDQIALWMPGGLFTLGTDGLGRSETLVRLRRLFAVNVESTIIGTLHALAEKISSNIARPSRNQSSAEFH